MAKKRTAATTDQGQLPGTTAPGSSTALAFPEAMPTQQCQTLHYEGWLTLRTPLTHGGDQSLGTTRLFRAQKTVCDDGVVRRIPVYSGNAFRGLLRIMAGAESEAG